MLIKELPPTWPPVFCASLIAGVKPDLQDVVVSVKNGGSGRAIVTLRKNQKYGPTYAITLNIPEQTFQNTLLAILRNSNTTLGDIGEIKVS